MIRPCSEPSGKRVTVNRIHVEKMRGGERERESGKVVAEKVKEVYIGTIDKFLCPGYRSFSIIHLRSGLL